MSVPDCTALSTLTLPAVARYWSMETGADPQDIARELAWAAYDWLSVRQDWRKSLRETALPSFLEVMAPESEEMREVLLTVALGPPVSSDTPAMLARVNIHQESFADWFRRRGLTLPRFWFKPEPVSESPPATPAGNSTLYRIIGALAQAVAELAPPDDRAKRMKDGKAFAGGGLKMTGIAGYLMDNGLTDLKPTALQKHIGEALKIYDRPRPKP